MFFAAAALLAAAGTVAASPCKPKPPTSTTTATPTYTGGSGWINSYTATHSSDVAAAAATAKTSSPTSHVKGKAFDRYVSIWFENTNYETAFGDPNFAAFAKKGITLTNFFGLTHVSEPNYLSAVAGDYFGMNNDAFTQVPYNVSTVFDLLDTKGISWGFYQEDMPYSGYEGYQYVNQKNGANDYVRKHNPGVLPDSVAYYEDRLSQIKNLSMIYPEQSQFHKDLKDNKLPQWIFVTPNMTSDAHDSDITVAGNWLDAFLTPLLSDKNFMDNTLVLITFDENEVYADRNHVLSVLVGDAVPEDLVGTTDGHFYNHYTELATVEANWGLPTLGRWDVGANVFEMVARSTGDKLREWDASAFGPFDSYYYNLSYAGPYNNLGGNPSFVKPNLELDNSFSGRKILDSIKETWKDSNLATYYSDRVEIPDGLQPPEGFAPHV